jgi:hypothetical protein
MWKYENVKIAIQKNTVNVKKTEHPEPVYRNYQKQHSSFSHFHISTFSNWRFAPCG